MAGINRVTLVGRTGKDPEIKNLDSGTKLAKMSLATSEKYKDKSGVQQEKTEWHNIVIWGKLAEICEKYVVKGQLLYVEGKLATRKYENKDGVTMYATEIIADTFQILSSKKENNSTSTNTTNSTPTGKQGEGDWSNNNGTSDDLPF